jgi:hypothetical protein
VLVSEVVEATAGPEFHFLDRGVHTLRGVPGEWHVSAVEARR